MNKDELMYYLKRLKFREKVYKELISEELFTRYRNLFIRLDLKMSNVLFTPMTRKEVENLKLGRYITPLLLAFKRDNGTLKDGSIL